MLILDESRDSVYVPFRRGREKKKPKLLSNTDLVLIVSNKQLYMAIRQ